LITEQQKDTKSEELLKQIRSGKEGRDLVLTSLYKNEKLRSHIKSVLYKMGGTAEHFNDLFSATLMQFVKTVIQKPDLTIHHEVTTYITSIARYLWIAKNKKDSKYSYSQEDNTDLIWVDSPETLVVRREKIDLLHELLGQLGKNCKEVLMHWANGYKMKEIAELMAYKSQDMAKKKKYQCFKTLLVYLENNPQIKAAIR